MGICGCVNRKEGWWVQLDGAENDPTKQAPEPYKGKAQEVEEEIINDLNPGIKIPKWFPVKAIKNIRSALAAFNQVADNDTPEAFASGVFVILKVSVPELSDSLSWCGENAPNFGLVFSVLAAFGQGQLEANSKELEGLREEIINTASLMREAESGRKYNASVDSAMEEYWSTLSELVGILCERRKEIFSEQFQSKGKFEEIRVAVQKSTRELYAVLNIDANTSVEDIREEIFKLLKPLDEVQYAELIKSQYGNMAGILGMMIEGFDDDHQDLVLNDVFVPQDVKAINPENGVMNEGTVVGSVLDFIKDPNVLFGVILGEPGYGKSSSLKHVALEWATADPEIRKSMSIPFYVELKQFSQVDDPLFDFIAKGGSIELDISEESLEKALRDSKRGAIVMLDGLDEVSDVDDVMGKIEALFNKKYPITTRFIITSRVNGHEISDWAKTTIPVEIMSHVAMQPFTETQVVAFLTQWNERLPAGKRFESRIRKAISKYPALKRLAQHPLFLTMLVAVNPDPEENIKQVELFHSCVNFFLEKWRIEGETDLQDYSIFNREKLELFLCDVAFEMQAQSGALENLIDKSIVEELLEKRKFPDDVDGALSFLQDTTGILCPVGDDKFAFVHQTFFDYFFALNITNNWKEKTTTAEKLVQLFEIHAKDPKWKEILTLLCGMLPAESLAPCFEALLSQKEVLLAADCWFQIKDPAKVESSIEDKLHEALKSNVHHSGALEFLALGWRNEETHQIVSEIAQSGKAGAADAIHILAENWDNEETREILEEVAKSDKKCADYAIDALANFWKDDRTRDLLIKIAQSGNEEGDHAIEMLAKTWQDNRTREVLVQLACSGEKIADGAIVALSSFWKDDEIRDLLLKIATSEKIGTDHAIIALADEWEGTLSREFLLKIAKSGKEGADGAIYALSSTWNDDETRELLKALSKNDQKGAKSAVYALANNWEGILSRDDLEGIAQSGKEEAGLGAMIVLTENWKDDRTHNLIKDIAQSDSQLADKAIRILAEEWTNDDSVTLNVLKEIVLSGKKGADAAKKALKYYWGEVIN